MLWGDMWPASESKATWFTPATSCKDILIYLDAHELLIWGSYGFNGASPTIKACSGKATFKKLSLRSCAEAPKPAPRCCEVSESWAIAPEKQSWTDLNYELCKLDKSIPFHIRFVSGKGAWQIHHQNKIWTYLYSGEASARIVTEIFSSFQGHAGTILKVQWQAAIVTRGRMLAITTMPNQVTPR